MKDIEIAQQANILPIDEIAKKINIPDDSIEHYGKYKAKIDPVDKSRGKLILVTSITPTPQGEGKSTITIGLVDGLASIGENVIGALREPSMGPVFGIKGGATGGGYSQVAPMEDINLHFTGDMHAITSANNLVSAAIDNHIFQGNELNIDPNKIVWKRCLDMNDRSLRSYYIEGKVSYHSDFLITVATELMAILCLSKNQKDFKTKLERSIIAYNYEGKPILLRDLNISGAIMAIMKDALKPNLVQTLENNPVLIHGGPFANIAHGCNSIIATQTALSHADYVITEAGFGSDLGAEKFMNIKTRTTNIPVSGVVIVVTIKALKHLGRKSKKEKPLEQIERGLFNLTQHVNNVKSFGAPVFITLNKFNEDKTEEVNLLKNYCKANKIDFTISEGYQKGGSGLIPLAESIKKKAKKTKIKYTYEDDDKLLTKINKVVMNVYGGNGVIVDEEIAKKIEAIDNSEYEKFPICMAKTPNSLSDDSSKIVEDRRFKIRVRDIKVNSGAGFIIVYTGNVLTMPGLSKQPAYEIIDLNDDNKITGLF